MREVLSERLEGESVVGNTQPVGMSGKSYRGRRAREARMEPVVNISMINEVL